MSLDSVPQDPSWGGCRICHISPFDLCQPTKAPLWLRPVFPSSTSLSRASLHARVAPLERCWCQGMVTEPVRAEEHWQQCWPGQYLPHCSIPTRTQRQSKKQCGNALCFKNDGFQHCGFSTNTTQHPFPPQTPLAPKRLLNHMPRAEPFPRVGPIHIWQPSISTVKKWIWEAFHVWSILFPEPKAASQIPGVFLSSGMRWYTFSHRLEGGTNLPPKHLTPREYRWPNESLSLRAVCLWHCDGAALHQGLWHTSHSFLIGFN